MQEGTKVTIDNEVYELKRQVISGYFATLIRTGEELFISNSQLTEKCSFCNNQVKKIEGVSVPTCHTCMYK